MTYDKRHGGPYDRGSADAYYGRKFTPHHYLGKTGSCRLEIKPDEPEFEAYRAGWNDQIEARDFKDWGSFDDK